MRAAALLPIVVAAALIPGAVTPAMAQEARVPIAVRALVDDTDAVATAQATLTLEFTPQEDITEAYTVALRLCHRMRQTLSLDHGPEPPTKTWKKDQKVTYTVPVPLPLAGEIESPRQLTVHLGFQDPSTRKIHPPARGTLDPSGLAQVTFIDLPDLDEVPADGAQAILDAAAKQAAAGNKAMAWRTLSTGVRRAVEDEEKHLFRDAMIALGEFAPAPVSIVEQRIVEDRIADEKRRYMRQMSGRFFNQKKYHASLLILDAIGGSLEEDADKAVLGAVDAVERTEKDKYDIQEKLVAQISDEDAAEADAAIESRGPTKDLLALANRWYADKRYGPARRLFQELRFCETKELRDEGLLKVRELDAAWIDDVPEEQRELVRGVVEHPAWARLGTLPMQEFILIGPRSLIESINARAKRRFDISYVFITDLFGRVPNPGGDRVTVFFKELWEFGGATGGGKQINVGNADPKQRGYPLDSGMMYHELTHCVDDVNPVLGGWREGLANVGSTFALETLGQDGLTPFNTNLRQFQKDYAERDLAYWRISEYGPSAGFFLHFVRAYAKKPQGHDWKPLRGFFRGYRTFPIRDGRTHAVARALAFFLTEHFGDAAFDDLIRFRLPLLPGDREAIALEMEAYLRGSRGAEEIEDEIQEFGNSPLKRDLAMKDVVELAERDASRAKEIAQEELGILFDWRVIGPFATRGTNPGACVFPPQDEIDFAAEYEGKGNICRWRKVTDPGPVSIRPTGWVDAKYAYMDNTATYGLTHVTVAEETPVAFHVRADDDFTLFVNGDLVEGLFAPGRNSSRGINWRGPHHNVADALRLDWTLKPGRNRILVKVRNRGGMAEFSVAVSHRDGSPVEGLVCDDGPAEGPLHPDEPRSWKDRMRQEFRSKSFRKRLSVTAGKFAVKNKLLVGTGTTKAVEWRKYTVRPGVEKDNPRNLMWIAEKYTEDLTDFRLTMDLVLPLEQAPKMVVTFQGDGLKDGLSGWNLILHPGGAKVLRAELERYQRLFHQSPPIDLEEAESRKLVLTYHDRRLTVRMGPTLVMDRVPVRPIAGQTRIGFATWNDAVKVESIELEVPR